MTVTRRDQGVVSPKATVGVPLRGAARCRTLQVGLMVVGVYPSLISGPTLRGAIRCPGGTEMASVDFETVRRYHGLWVWLETGTRGLVRFRSGRYGDTVRWECVVFAGWFGLGCRRSGRFGDTFRLGWMSNFCRTDLLRTSSSS